MRRSSLVAAALMVAAGTVLIGQGLGLLRGSSFMINDLRWAWIGGAMVILGVALGAVALRHDRP